MSTVSPYIQQYIINMTVTFALASLAASASAAMALWSWTGSLTSLLQHGYSRLVISSYRDRVQAGRPRGAPDIRSGISQAKHIIYQDLLYFNHFYMHQKQRS